MWYSGRPLTTSHLLSMCIPSFEDITEAACFSAERQNMHTAQKLEFCLEKQLLLEMSSVIHHSLPRRKHSDLYVVHYLFVEGGGEGGRRGLCMHTSELLSVPETERIELTRIFSCFFWGW